MRIRFNGWQRIGIVLSIMWLVGFTAHMWNVEAKRATNFYGYEWKMCAIIAENELKSLLSGRYEEDWVKQSAQIDAEAKKCRDSAEAYFNKSINDRIYKSIPIWLAESFGIIVLGWLVAWFLVGIAKWIRRGFA